MPYQRAHPMLLLRFMRRFLYLLILPTARGLFYALSSDLFAWLATAWIDLAVMAALVLFAFVRWRRFGFFAAPEGLYLRAGVFWEQRLFVSRRCVCGLESERGWLMALFCARRVSVRITGGSRRLPPVTFYVTRRQLAALMAQYGLPASGPIRRCRPDGSHAARFSALDSSALGGVLFVSVLLMRQSRRISRVLQQLLFGAVEGLTQALQPWVVGVPAAAVALSLLLLLGFAVSFVRTLLRHGKMQIALRGDRLTVSAGIVSRHHCRFDRRQIAFLENRQSILCRLLRLDTVYLDSPGYTGPRGKLRVLFLSAPQGESRAWVERLLPQFSALPLQLRPCRASLWLYLRLPLCIGGLLLCLSPAVERLTAGFWRGLLAGVPVWPVPPLSMAWIPLLWWLLLRCVGFAAAGLGGDAERLTLCYPKGWRIRTVTVPRTAVQAVRILQSRRQKRRGRCTLEVYTGRDRCRRHRVAGLPDAAVREMFGKEN